MDYESDLFASSLLSKNVILVVHPIVCHFYVTVGHIVDAVHFSAEVWDIVSHYLTALPLIYRRIIGEMEILTLDRMEYLRGCVHGRSVCHNVLVQQLIPVPLIVRDNFYWMSSVSSVHSSDHYLGLQGQGCLSFRFFLPLGFWWYLRIAHFQWHSRVAYLALTVAGSWFIRTNFRIILRNNPLQ